jgi:hypothetical protein
MRRDPDRLRPLCELHNWQTETKPAPRVLHMGATVKRAVRGPVQTPWRDTWAAVFEDIDRGRNDP